MVYTIGVYNGKIRVKMMSILHLTDLNYEQTVAEKDAVLVEFWAEWCTLCKQMKPILEDIEQKYADKLTVAMVDVASESYATEKMEVMSLPALFIYKQGRLVGKVTGFVPKETLTGALDQLIL
ncbi:thioredoxin family protein [Cohnella cholangitidis]|nr:thioredoxin domain-containing protein [Cohnella cholangitidis]